MHFTVRFKILFAASKSLKISFISLLVKKIFAILLHVETFFKVL